MARSAKRYLAPMEFPDLTEFPDNPSIGRWAFVNSVMYVYANLGGFSTWFPINRPQSSFVHSQGVSQLVWTINHGMGTEQVMVAVYDNANNILDASVQHLQDGSDNWYTKVTLTEASAGYAVVFGIENISAPIMSAQHIEVANSITIADKPVMVDADIANALDGITSEFDNYSTI